MAPDTENVESVVLNPRFNYHRHVAILKRFMEQLVANGSKLADDQVRYIEANLPHVVNAMSEVLADDVERQIQITKDFPMRHPGITFHEFVDGGAKNRSDQPLCTHEDCFAVRDWLVHTL